MVIRLFFFFLIISSASFGQLKGKVISIADGDTFTLLVENRQIKIRLHGIDCPEKGQDFYQAAKQFLSDKIFNKNVLVMSKGKDRYGRTVGLVLVDGINVNEELLKAGLAWHYKRYDRNPSWEELEHQARIKKKGIWSQPNPGTPSEWRKAAKLRKKG